MRRTYLIKSPEDYDAVTFHERDSLRFICKRCRNEVFLKHINLKKLKDYKLMLCRGCLQKHTKKKLYGDENYNNRDKFVITAHNWSEEQKKKRLQARINTDLKKHGVAYFNNSAKTSKTKNAWSFDRKAQMVNKIKNTKQLRYGDPNYNNSEQMIESKKNWIKEQKDAMIDRIRNTKLQKYGNPYYSNRELAVETLRNKSPEEKKSIQNKRKHSLKKAYGDENYNNRQQYKNTMLTQYGLLHVNYSYSYYGAYFDSSWELAVWIYCIDHNIPIIRNPCRFEYTYNDKDHYYEPDFMINNELVEIKGDQFLNKSTNKWINPYDRSLDNLYETKHQCAINNNVKILYSSECKEYVDYCNTKYPNWDNIYRKDNPYNPSYWCYITKGKGIPPYNININSEYSIVGKGIGPYDIIK